jgi:hypothetical protein
MRKGSVTSSLPEMEDGKLSSVLSEDETEIENPGKDY